MTTYAAPESWGNLEKDCQLNFGCADFQLKSANNRKDRKSQRKIEDQRNRIGVVTKAFQQALKDNPTEDPKMLVGSVLAILLPWIFPLLREWFIGKFESLVINWILNRLKIEG
jgi:hypothetical protein